MAVSIGGIVMDKIKLILGALILLFGSMSAQAVNFQIDYMMLEADLKVY
jgi:hypothetical protein